MGDLINALKESEYTYKVIVSSFIAIVFYLSYLSFLGYEISLRDIIEISYIIAIIGIMAYLGVSLSALLRDIKESKE